MARVFPRLAALALAATLPGRPLDAMAKPGASAPAAAQPKKDMWVETADAPVKCANAGVPDFAGIAKFARQSVVSITATSKDEVTEVESDNPSAREFFERFYGGSEPQTKGMASGFIIRSDGYILTNEHVVEEAGELAVTLADDDGRSYPATVVGRDDLSDLALIKIDVGKPLPALPLGNSNEIAVGDWVTAIGNPFGLSNSLSVGVVSFIGRRDISPSGRPGYYDFIQTDAAINPGNSGGPLVDRSGRVIGISAAVNASGQGIGFAIPINMAKDVLPALYDTGTLKRAFMGVTIQDLSPELAESFGSKTGVVVTEIAPDGPAARGGLAVGDVITALNDSPIERTYRLRWLTSNAGVGTVVKVGFMRHGTAQTSAVTLAPLPGAPGKFHREPAPKPRPDLAPLGFSVAGPVSMPAGKGLRVAAIDPLSSAYAAGLREGDMILTVGERPVKGTADLQTVSAKARGALTRLFVQRGVRAMFVAFKSG
jgi:serine protease Do